MGKHWIPRGDVDNILAGLVSFWIPATHFRGWPANSTWVLLVDVQHTSDQVELPTKRPNLLFTSQHVFTTSCPSRNSGNEQMGVAQN